MTEPAPPGGRRAGALITGVLLAAATVLTGCGAAPTPATGPASPTRSSAAPAPEPGPTPDSDRPSGAAEGSGLPAAADGTDLAACSDGSCEVLVEGRTAIPLGPHLDVSRWVVTPRDPDLVDIDVVSSGGARSVFSGNSFGDSSGSDSSVTRIETTEDETTATMGGPGATLVAGGVAMRLVATDGRRAVVAFRPR